MVVNRVKSISDLYAGMKDSFLLWLRLFPVLLLLSRLSHGCLAYRTLERAILITNCIRAVLILTFDLHLKLLSRKKSQKVTSSYKVTRINLDKYNLSFMSKKVALSH